MLLLYLNSIEDSEEKKIFEYYYKTYRHVMYSAAYAVVGNCPDAEDAVHDAFLAISKNMSVLLYADESKGKYYCVKAAKNTALNILRSSKHKSDIPFDELYDSADERSFEETVENAEYNDILAAIKELNGIYADVLYMRYVMDMSVKQISDTLGRKTATVKQQLIRGKKLLQERLGRVNG